MRNGLMNFTENFGSISFITDVMIQYRQTSSKKADLLEKHLPKKHNLAMYTKTLLIPASFKCHLKACKLFFFMSD